MNKHERERAVADLMESEMQRQLGTWWVSFANGQSFNGVVIVRARGIVSAVHEVRRHGAHPGHPNEVLAYHIDALQESFLTEADYNRLLTADEALAIRRRWAPN